MGGNKGMGGGGAGQRVTSAWHASATGTTSPSPSAAGHKRNECKSSVAVVYRARKRRAEAHRLAKLRPVGAQSYGQKSLFWSWKWNIRYSLTALSVSYRL